MGQANTLGARDTAVSKTAKVTALMEISFWRGEKDNYQSKIIQYFRWGYMLKKIKNRAEIRNPKLDGL